MRIKGSLSGPIKDTTYISKGTVLQYHFILITLFILNNVTHIYNK